MKISQKIVLLLTLISSTSFIVFAVEEKKEKAAREHTPALLPGRIRAEELAFSDKLYWTWKTSGAEVAYNNKEGFKALSHEKQNWIYQQWVNEAIEKNDSASIARALASAGERLHDALIHKGIEAIKKIMRDTINSLRDGNVLSHHELNEFISSLKSH